MPYLVRTPGVIRPLARDLVWDLPGSENEVYLTFDDGPIPEVTPWVLDQLEAYGAKGTFFCIGRNAWQNPALLQRIRNEGHAVGNHTWDHADGWRTPLFSYLRSTQRAQEILGTDLFRPPYGKITRSAVKAIAQRYRIIMWSVLSADFDTTLDGATCVRNVLGNVRPGSIIVFHDSLKAWPRLQLALPEVLQELRARGFAMRAIPGTIRP